MPSAEILKAYVGHWVALVRDDIVGVGRTAEAARLAAQLSRPKEKTRLMFVSDPTPLLWPPHVEALCRAIPADARVWLVGGAVRDVLLNRRLHDLDFVVDGHAIGLARRVANILHAAFYPLDDERDVGRVIVKNDEGEFILDFAHLRGDTLTADLNARDFTLNAMAADLTDPSALIDPLGGHGDLRAKRLRACSPTAISDDPVRAVRAIRLAAQLNLKLEADTRAAVRAHAPALAQVSGERLRDELLRCLNGPRPGAALRALEMLGLLAIIAPELAPLKGLTQSPPHTLDVWEHTLAVVTRLDEITRLLGPVHDVDAASELTLGLISVRLGRYRQHISDHLQTPLAGDRPTRALLMLGALLHDVGKASTRTVEASGRIRFLAHEVVGADECLPRLEALRLSTDEVRRARTIITHHMRPRQIAQEQRTASRRAIYRYFRDTGPVGVDIVLLTLADYLGKFSGSPPPQDEWAHLLLICAQLLEAYFEKRAETIAPPPLLSGHDLMNELNLTPGPHFSEILNALREAQATGDIADRAAALEFARHHPAAQTGSDRVGL